MEEKVKRVAVYARVSTKDQDCGRQLRALSEYAATRGLEVVATFTEKASGMKNNRAERAKVMKLAQARAIDAVLVTELSRWGRSTIDLLSSLQDLDGLGVGVIAQSGMTFDLSTAQGKLVAQMLSALAEFERNLLKERIDSGLAHAKAKGTRLGRPPGRDTTNDARVLKLHAKGFGLREIARTVGCAPMTVSKILKERVG